MHTHIEIAGRSPQQILDDEHVEASNHINELLSAMSCGRCLYIGEQRAQLKRLLARTDAYIAGEGLPVERLWARLIVMMGRR